MENCQDSASNEGFSFGDKVVGLKFNPSGNPDVNLIKTYISAIIDLIENFDIKNDNREKNCLSIKFKDYAIHDLLTAQMMAVKFVTAS